MPNTTIRVPLSGEELRRELEKEQIRREIITGEIQRRRELEKEVIQELALEKALGIPMQMWFLERVPNHLVPVPVPVPIDDDISGMRIVEITLAKPDPDLYSAKRKADTLAVNGTEPYEFALKKKPKVEWSCPLCQVDATSEGDLNAHLYGKKHRAKEKALTTQKTQKFGESTEASLLSRESDKSVKTNETILTTTLGLDAKADKEMPQPCITLEDMSQIVVDKGVIESKNEEQLVQKNHAIGGLENQNGTETEEAGKTNALTTSKVTFWCEICQIFTSSPVVMETHKKGKKHLKQMKKYSQTNTSVLPISFVSPEASGLIKDTDAVNKEGDQMITAVVKEQTKLKMEEIVSDSDEQHPVAESSGEKADGGL